MKGQQLFYSFLPGVTAAVLTTQSAWAGTTVKVGEVKLVSSPSVLTANDVKTSIADNINRQLPNTTVDSSPVLVPAHDFSNLGGKPSVNHSVPEMAVVNNAKVPVEKISKTVLPVPATGGKVAQLPAKNKCLQAGQKSQAALLLVLNACSQKKATIERVAQVTVPTESGTPNTSEPPVQNTETVTPVPTGSVETPEQLNPSSNPLLFPTEPEAVRLQANQPISLSQALELAKRNNNELQVSILQLERSKGSVREQQAALLPTVGLSGSVANSRSASNTLAATQQQKLNPNAPDASSDTSFSGQAQLRYDLYTSGRRNAAIREAEEQVRIQELDVERQVEDIRLNVAREYYDLQQADEQVRISQSAVQNAEASLRDANALERAGVGTRFDVLRSQVNLANAQQDLTNAVSQQQIARRRLATRLNISQSVNISAADPVQLAGLWNETLEKSIVLAYQNRPELQQQLAQRQISEQQRRQALATLGPQISLVASYDLLDVFNDSTSVSDGYSVGVQATLNLYDGGAAKARASQAKSNIAIAETQFSEQRNQIRFQVEQAYSTQRSNLENVQTANVALEQAKEALRLARLRFQAGVGTQTDVINSENDLTRSEGNRIRAILDYNRALTELQRFVTSRAFNQ
ncbi:TolC family protein [Anabaena cylindrica FACHB-243]|uniref:Outer membrane efflux protein n=1 Tax=Anabaena cylindrica (strain ATCC 27899 / PCC 7122) TaxID=272123 RepID=K9ZJP0_ANACC|nr:MULTISPECIES: TolC family protein [Anabaena]AFZ58742.1 outer membrane efflux protein [Anabaena cylindrica PCC 7122]MBD2420084.1 TolC family protein [Anabaena cylindrica FACHB-243]MBY5282945.1 TolC family protein [Anabaena sp. CCAP 1446/1C]MBY5306556.1 TolC family protein [Anabaena sp. CCAP 1446/1C]MCM2407019.1 TolC family protein [Anabaena sp. CCAP 1446/1C]